MISICTYPGILDSFIPPEVAIFVVRDFMDAPFPTVVIADDHALFREAVVTVLTQIGFQVVLEAVDGFDLLRLLSRPGPVPDVFVLDIDMPVMDGYETARRLQRDYPGIKIIALTQFYDRDKERCILKMGAERMLTKGSDPDVWKEAILKTYAGK